jgi:tRNA (guanine-N7-)-methyltransferase
MDKITPHSPVRSFVLRKGRMSRAQQSAYEELKEVWTLPFQETQLEFSSLFPAMKDIILEIGFGMGDATHQIACDNPDKAYLGVEVHKPGVGKLLDRIHKRGLENIRIIEYDACRVVDKMIPSDSLAGVHIFFPDPWPKKKHHKRRLIKEPFITELAGKLRKGGYLYAVTDWEEYASQILSVMSENELLNNKFENYADHQSWRPLTKFEQKGLKKSHTIREILFVKK